MNDLKLTIKHIIGTRIFEDKELIFTSFQDGLECFKKYRELLNRQVENMIIMNVPFNFDIAKNIITEKDAIYHFKGISTRDNLNTEILISLQKN